MKLRVAAHPTMVYPAKLALLAAVYLGAALFGLQYASIGRSVSLIWPPSGIAFAALTLLGYRYWPGVALGAFLANAATDVPILASTGIALGNTLESLVTAFLLRRAAGSSPQLTDLRTVRTIILTAAPVGALCGAVIGPLSLRLTDALPTALPTAIAAWWTGDVLGMLVVGPILLTWATPRQQGQNGPAPANARQRDRDLKRRESTLVIEGQRSVRA